MFGSDGGTNDGIRLTSSAVFLYSFVIQLTASLEETLYTGHEVNQNETRDSTRTWCLGISDCAIFNRKFPWNDFIFALISLDCLVMFLYGDVLSQRMVEAWV